MEPDCRFSGTELLLGSRQWTRFCEPQFHGGYQMSQEMILKLAKDTLQVTLLISGPCSWFPGCRYSGQHRPVVTSIRI
jgi:hypothetical protein